MKVELFDIEEHNILKNSTSNVEAYNLYLLGLFEWYKRSEENMNRSISYFEKALQIDPNYTLAYCGIANSYSALTDWGGLLAKEALPIARNALEKAMQIDPELAEIYASFVYLNLCEWDMDRCEKNFKKAISINPKAAVAYHHYGLQEACIGRFDNALSQNSIAREVDPLNMIFNFAYGFIL